MKPLLAFTDRHPAGTGVVGTLSGVASALIAALHFTAAIASDLAVVFSCACAVLTFLLLVRKYRRKAVHRRLRKLRNAAQRRQAREQDLDEDELR